VVGTPVGDGERDRVLVALVEPPAPSAKPAVAPAVMNEAEMSTRPHPELLLGEGPASEGVYCPVSSTAALLLISTYCSRCPHVKYCHGPPCV
jgi:hypothetical protein